MLFIYLLIFSVVAIISILIIEHRRSRVSLLQMIKKLCSIDSIQFEDRLKKTRQHSLKIRNNVSIFRKKKLSYIKAHSEFYGKQVRSFIRKKFHPATNTQETSSFIKHIKEE